MQVVESESDLGIGPAAVVYGSNARRSFFPGLRDMLGGRTGAYKQGFDQGQKEAIAEVEQRAQRLGANGVIGIDLNTGTISIDQRGGLLLITAPGTAANIRWGTAL